MLEVILFSPLRPSEPSTYEQAIASPEQEKWIQAMNDEIHALEKNKTWTLVDCPSEKQILPVKWVYRIKTNADGQIERFKARLVEK